MGQHASDEASGKCDESGVIPVIEMISGGKYSDSRLLCEICGIGHILPGFHHIQWAYHDARSIIATWTTHLN